MDNVNKFLLYQQKWSDEFCNKNFDEYEKIAKEGIKFRNENFTKEDWVKLIAQSTGRAKYEYTRKMNELFNEDGTRKFQKSNDLFDGKLSD